MMTEGTRSKLGLARRMLFDNGGLEEIFRHVRNLVMATLVIAAGMHAIENGRSLEIKGLPNIAVAGYIVSVIGTVLFLLNLADGLHRLSKVRRHLALQILLLAIYVFITLRVTQLVLALRMSAF
ncbi:MULTISPECIES: hypothetical protein [Ensifer]|uniref:Uncharacterized protein n=2 Tax=Sinorhizobium/Ensifer group TaxID=227292 RepID=A0AAW4FCZ5_9HYPH|nr:hypothetical protein ASD00_01505 [Ensifer sp. Root31]KQW63115.1 hypothetical protein ASD02_03145 [Ensifer sp. Root1252]KQW85131.1 hypothetical protein ASD03_05340 [Ensifer sp. Root127]KQY71108.1 hypothetical protein ASD52_05240 [Ensifer sp. Root142]KRC83936.1 hypothetical protein ASE32_03135 [Ensifer sp. Root231]KRD04289.1 hypothetical protein ASE47_01795 [Ensifer sp. Root258]MBD9485879.1 hypothetical protein [Ensifer sp. ENS11]MBM3090014.1 hypothetical protein [Ensifer canadensis]OMQ450